MNSTADIPPEVHPSMSQKPMKQPEEVFKNPKAEEQEGKITKMEEEPLSKRCGIMAHMAYESITVLFRYLKIFLVVSLYWFVSITMVFVNKSLLSGQEDLDAPFFVTW